MFLRNSIPIFSGAALATEFSLGSLLGKALMNNRTLIPHALKRGMPAGPLQLGSLQREKRTNWYVCVKGAYWDWSQKKNWNKMKTSHFNSLLKRLSNSASSIVSILSLPVWALTRLSPSHFMLTATLGGWGNYYFHFTEEEMEVQRGRYFPKPVYSEVIYSVIPRNDGGWRVVK